MPLTTADKRAAFKKLHESGCFIIPNPFDAGSARALQHLGFKALASTSAGFAWTIAKHVKSNAIVYAKGGSTAGIGAGQMNRLESARIAAWKAKDAADKAGWATPRTIGSAVASDAFFPFPDGLLQAADAGCTAVIQPGGSIGDQAVIDAADERGLAMVFTGMRHFRH